MVVGPLQTFVNTIKDAKQHLIAAAAGRGTSILIMFPLDVIKTRIQLDHPNPFRMKGLLNGVGGSLVGQIPYGALTFGSYEVYKDSLKKRFANRNPLFSYALAAVGGDLTGSVWLCPSEVVKSKVQAGIFENSLQACAEIFKTKGIRGFYQGYLGLAARDVPFRVCQLTSYEIVKGLYLKAKKKKNNNPDNNNKSKKSNDLSPLEAAVCGAIAGTFSAAVTTPLDRIKTILATSATETSVVACASRILQEEGMNGLFAGLGPRVLYVGPSVTIFFIVYEATQQRLQQTNSSSMATTKTKGKQN